MKIAVVGTGYVGLVTGTCLAEAGNIVTGIDVDKAKVSKMKKGQVPIYEPGLESIFKRNVSEGRLNFTTNLKTGVKGAEIIFLALPTPPNEDGSADLSYVLGVAEELGPLLEKYTIVVDKSTVPIGTAEKVRATIAKGTTTKFDVVSNPEFLREGFAINDFMHPDRIVIGTNSAKARNRLSDLYRSFVTEESQIIFMDEASSEMTKYAANSFLATKISFMNEIANLCERVGADVEMVRVGIGSDERIGRRFLFAGIGYGGSCFPKDVSALYKIGEDNSYDFKIIQAASEVNAWQRRVLVNKVDSYFKGQLKGKTLALWGLAFKPDTDDIREAPARTIIDELTTKGARLVVYDPEAVDNGKALYKKNKNVKFAPNRYKALEGADALLIATEWSEFRTPDYSKMKAKMNRPVIFDGRNLYDLETMKETGFYYQSIGRSTIKSSRK